MAGLLHCKVLALARVAATGQHGRVGQASAYYAWWLTRAGWKRNPPPPTLLSRLSKWCWRMAHWMQLLSTACAICSLQLNKLWQVTRHNVPLTC